MVKLCCVKGCRSECYIDCGISFHRFPKDEKLRAKWLKAIGGKITCKDPVVCSHHFKKEDYRTNTFLPRLLVDAVPCIQDSDDDTLESDDETVVVKAEPDEFTEEEDDPWEQLAKKRQREEEATQAEIKKPKLENVHVIPIEKRVEVPIEKDVPSGPGCDEHVMVPEIFMETMLRRQNEILDTLKTHVLMQNPGPKLLTFLRFLGAKMQKLSEQRRKELQYKIIQMVLQETDLEE